MKKEKTIRKQGFLKGSAILLGMVVITKILGLMYKIPLTRLLGGTGMGYFLSAYSVFTPLLAAVCAGVPSALARISAENYALERYRNLRRQKLTAHIIFGFAAFTAAALVIVFSGFLAGKVINEKNAVYALVCIAPSVIFCTFISVERGYYEGLQNMLPTAISEIVETVFRLILGLGFAYAVRNYGIESFEKTGICFGTSCKNMEECICISLPYIAAGAIAGSTLASLFACIYLFISGRIHGDGITKSMIEKDRFADKFSVNAKILLKCSFPCTLVSVITTVTNMIDMLTVNPMISMSVNSSADKFKFYLDSGIEIEQLPNFMYGSYTGLAVTVYGLVPTLTAMFGKSLLPSLCGDYAKGNMQGAKNNLYKMLWLSSIISLPSGLGICVLSKPVLSLLFGSRTLEIAAAAQPLSILGLGVVFTGIYLPCLTILQSLCKPAKTVGIMAAGGIIKFVLNILLISMPDIGINGAAISTVCSDFFVCILSVIAVMRLVKGNFSISELYLKPLYGGILCSVTAYLSQVILTNQQILELNVKICLLISIAFGVIMYVFSLYLLCEMPKNLINQFFLKKN